MMASENLCPPPDRYPAADLLRRHAPAAGTVPIWANEGRPRPGHDGRHAEGRSMTATGNNHLRVPGATLFYRVRGNGPVLLVSPGGHGDADSTDALCEKLISRYT